MNNIFPSSYTERFFEVYNKKVDELLFSKLSRLKLVSLEQGNYELYKILDNIEFNNISKTKRELEKHGYSIEFDQPRPLFTSDENVIKATVQLDDVKLKVRKLLFEV